MSRPEMTVTVDNDGDGTLYHATMGEAEGFSGLRQVAIKRCLEDFERQARKRITAAEED